MAECTIPNEQNRAATEGTAPSTMEEGRYLVPPVDIFETKEGLTVIVDLPGVAKESLSISVEDSVLTIEATPEKGQLVDPFFSEFTLRRYFRQFQLGEAVDREKISADLKHGVLTLRLPRAESSKPRKIEVNIEA